MSRILVYTTPARGHLFPATPIMDELHSRGHNIALRTLGSQVPMMRKRGFDVAPIDPRIEEIAINDYFGRTPFDAQKRAMRAFCERARFDAVDLKTAIEEFNPDALLIDINAWGALTVAEKWGGPWASWVPIRYRCRPETCPRSARACVQSRARSGDCATRSWGRCSSGRWSELWLRGSTRCASNSICRR